MINLNLVLIVIRRYSSFSLSHLLMSHFLLRMIVSAIDTCAIPGTYHSILFEQGTRRGNPMLVDSHGFTYEVNFKQLASKLYTGDVESAQKVSTVRLL